MWLEEQTTVGHPAILSGDLGDKHAPVKERVMITVRPSAPWYTAEVTAKKQESVSRKT